ncbi:unconventional myosin-XV-like isoform X2 [Daphnia pulicaria]|uniref:unconventional myosin-XV-like isoform X2 n=1 Tax=Daphnia pulicaria TaxID=35523 RepID=UPI001EEA6FBB|nr:unconventional myosin-XV-like isoform X2 [Daphnia pulicaria]
MSDTSETVSLASHVRRVRVPSQCSDVDQYLDDLFMPVLDGNTDEYSDARPLVASIKKGNQKLKGPLTGFMDTLIIDKRLDEDFGAHQVDSLAASIQGGDKGLMDHIHLSPSCETPLQPMGSNIETPQQSLDLMSLSPLLMPGFFRGFPSTGAPNSYHGAGPTSNIDYNSHQDLSLAFIQSAVVQNMQIQQQLMTQNMQIQQQLMTQNQALQQLLNTSSDSTTEHVSNARKLSISHESTVFKGAPPTTLPLLPATEGEIKNSLNPLSVVKGREISPDGQLMDVQAALESVNKFKILRPKFELVTADYQKTSRSSNERQPEMNGPNDINGVRKLEDKRSLVFQQELINGRKWDSVEELEHIARRASCGDRRYVIEAVHQIPPADQVDRARRSSDVSSSNKRPSQLEMARRSSSPPTTYYSTQPTQLNDGKHSLLQFALNHFRPHKKFEEFSNDNVSSLLCGSGDNSAKKKSKNKKSKDRPESVAGADWTWKEQVDLVKFTKSPIPASLLQLDSKELNKLALEVFISIMKYMGDYPIAKGQSEIDSVYTILMNCHNYEVLRDETYCQIMKQTTNNKSTRPDSCQRGWILFSIMAAYFSCSEVLKPYLFKYLEAAAYDKRRAYHGTAMVSLQNLRKTLRYGGRKNMPSIEEIAALTAGRNSKRQMYRLPGGTERVINTQSTSIVQDVIEEICGLIDVRSEEEIGEYSLYCIVEGDTFTTPLAREEYILDVTTALQKNQQVAPDYLEGLLLVMPGEQISQDCVYDIAKVAALLHRAADFDHMPTMKETKYLLPKPALSVRDIKPPQWVNLVQSSWKEVEHFKPFQAKVEVLEVLEKWPLFGSSFFAVRRDADPAERSESILALNRNGVHFLDVITHETLVHYSYFEVISTRKVKSEEGHLFLDMKCGNLMLQRVNRIQTDQAHEISRLIRQYITIYQRIQQHSVKEEDNLASH